MQENNEHFKVEGERKVGETVEVQVSKSGSGELITMPVAIVIASIVLGGSLVYTSMNGGVGLGNKNNNQNAPSVIGDQGGNAPTVDVMAIGERDVVLGDPNAKVTIVEYGDYQCPFCGRFHKETFSLIKTNYVDTGKARVIYRDFAFLGPESIAASESAECAKDQGKFWPYHDALYTTEIADGQEHNGNLNRELFISLAKSAGMNVAEFTKCIDDGKYKDVVASESSNGQQAGVDATPTTFVNGERVQGAQPYAKFKSAIDAALAKVK